MDWRARFDAYLTRKTTTAERAAIPGFRTVVDSSAGFGLERIGNAWTRTHFDGPFLQWPVGDSPLPAVSLVFVQSRDGDTETTEPWTLGGGETDLHLVYEGLSRVAADAVLLGAQTVCVAGNPSSVWHPAMVSLRAALELPRHPIQIVASLLGKLPLEAHLVFNVPELSVVILTTAPGARRLEPAARSRPWITVLDSGEHSDLRRQLCALRARGIRRVSCLGGRNLATALLDAGLVHDLYLTTGTRSGATPATPYYAGREPPARSLVLRKVGRDDEAGVVFEHWLY